MNGPYRVEGTQGCGQCGHGESFDVIGPDDVAHSTTYGDEEEANSVCRGFDRAYELGKAAGLLEKHPWTAFAEGALPPNDDSILVWDAQYNNMTMIYWISSIHNLETAQQMQWSHWIAAKGLIPPPPGAKTEPAAVDYQTIPQAVPTVQPPADETVEKVKPPSDWTDDIPF